MFETIKKKFHAWLYPREQNPEISVGMKCYEEFGRLELSLNPQEQKKFNELFSKPFQLHCEDKYPEFIDLKPFDKK